MRNETVNPENYINLLKSIVYKFIKNQKIEDSEIYSCGCVALMNALKTYDDSKGSFSTWATKIITTSIIDYYRKNKKYKKAETLIDETSNISDESEIRIPDQLLSVLLKENNKEKKTDKQNRQILIDYYLNNKSWTEIGKKFKLSRETVRQKGQKAINNIREKHKLILDDIECSYF